MRRTVWLTTILLLAAGAPAQIVNGVRMGGAANGPAGAVNLPYISQDGAGGLWYVYNDGALRQQMNPAIFAQGAMITIDGGGFNVPNNQGRVDAKTGELILENPQMNGATVTRHILFDKDAGYVRYIDTISNPTQQDRTVNVGLQTVLNWGVQQGQVVNDAKHKDAEIAWLGTTNMSRTVLEIYAGVGAKVGAAINYQNGGNVIQANYNLTVPAAKELALMHVHMFVPTVDAGNKTIGDLTAAKLTRGIAPAIRREIVNFAASQSWNMDLEILRGDVFDVVEMRGGDQFKGTLKETRYKLDSFVGPLELSSAQVIGLFNVGILHPRQLVVMQDGEIFGGQLSKPTIDLALTSGQVISIPVAQISRIGYRKRANEPEEFTFDKPVVLMRGGDRMEVELGGQPIAVASRYGIVPLDAKMIGAVSFQTEETGVHDIALTDGSHFAGLVCGDALEAKLAGAGPAETVQIPISGLLRLQMSTATLDEPGDGPVLTMNNHDVLCGSLEGTLHLRTAFDVIAIDGGQIRKLARAEGGDILVTLWDGSAMSGQIEEPAVQCRLLSGAELKAPAPLIKTYDQPHPMPSPEMVQQIQAAAADLAADDWRQRDRAEATLESMGPAVIGVLQDTRSKLAPEAQQRIDAIIKKLEGHAAKPAGQPGQPNLPIGIGG